MLTSTGGEISLRGQWQGRFEGYSPGGDTDPADCTFKITLWPTDACPGRWDYGWLWWTGPRSVLEAATDDGTGKLVFDAVTGGFVLDWLFPASDTARLEPGTYSVSVTATLAGDTLELARYMVVAR